MTKSWRLKCPLHPKCYVKDFLVIFKNIIGAFAEYLRYSKELQFEDEPDYKYLKKLMRRTVEVEKLYNEKVFDWVLIAVSLIRINNRSNLLR